MDPKKLKNDPVYFIENVIAAHEGYSLCKFQKDWLRTLKKMGKSARICFSFVPLTFVVWL